MSEPCCIELAAALKCRVIPALLWEFPQERWAMKCFKFVNLEIDTFSQLRWQAQFPTFQQATFYLEEAIRFTKYVTHGIFFTNLTNQVIRAKLPLQDLQFQPPFSMVS